jgi:hypothetical protein
MRLDTRNGESGQVLVLAAVVMAAMVGLLAFAVDTGIFLETRRELHNAADAAALAGIIHVPEENADALAAAAQYSFNIAEGPDRIARRLCELGGGTVPTHTSTIGQLPLAGGGFVHTLTVATNCTAGHIFGRVLGLAGAPISTTAVAAKGSLTAPNCPFPVGADLDLNGPGPGDGYVFDATTLVPLKLGSVQYGNAHAVAFGDPGGATFRDWLAGQCGGTFETGETVDSEPGMMVGPTGQGLTGPPGPLRDCTGPAQPALCAQRPAPGVTYRAACPDTVAFVLGSPPTPDVVNDSACLRVLPVVEWTNVNGRETMRVVRWAVFFITGYANSPPDYQSTIWGFFVRASVLGEMGAYDPNSVPIIRLIR